MMQQCVGNYVYAGKDVDVSILASDRIHQCNQCEHMHTLQRQFSLRFFSFTLWNFSGFYFFFRSSLYCHFLSSYTRFNSATIRIVFD